ncbi:hypothetical protein ACWKWP_13200 [Agromyces soli]
MTDSTADRGDDRTDSRNRSDKPKRDGAPRNASSKPYQARNDGAAGDRAKRDPKPWHKDGDRKPHSDREGKSGERKPWHRDGKPGERKSYGDRDGRPGERKPYGDRGGKPGERKPWDRDGKPGERKSYGDRDGRSGERKPYGDRGGKPGERKPWDRDGKPGERKSYGDRDGRSGERRPWDRDGERRPARSGGGRSGERKPWDRDDRGGPRRHEASGGRDRGGYGTDRPSDGAHQRQVRPRHDDPIVPEHIKPASLDRGARAELKTLTKENADWVAMHLAAAAEYLEVDPELAHRHALSASRRGGRIGVVRESLAITAYATGDFALALRELRTYRRITGSNEQLPLMVDSERGVGRPDRALELGRSVDRSTLPAGVQVSLAIAMSGARLDQGDAELALAELEIPQLDPDRAFSYSPALFLAYAEVLAELGREDDAARWRTLASRAEAALAGPAEEEVFEVFELDDEAFEVVELDEIEPVADPSDAAADHASAEADAHADHGLEAVEGEPADAAVADVESDRAPAESTDDVEPAEEIDAEESDRHGAVPNED